MARELTLHVGDSVWICSNNTRKSAVGIVSGLGTGYNGESYADVCLAPDCDYYDWDLEKLLHPETREIRVPPYRLEPVKF